ncbi:hypothetical protein DQ353_00260 [Arthrobacter sp. AQ5-05]|nr:hypothetical protein DQ353_00260 [Arthrobacter sp. AQ5-05]
MGLREAAVPEGKELVVAGTVETLGHRLEELTESYSALIMAREDVGWQKITQDAAQEFSRQGLKTSAELSRVFVIANPLLKRGNALRVAYVHGQGVGTTATGDGAEGSQDVNGLIQEWLDDPEVREVFAGAQAQERNETSLTTDGNVFFSLFTNPLTGRVNPRLIDFDEVEDKVTKPGDKTTTWYYLRAWVEVDGSGREVQRKAYYPDITYRPLARPKFIQHAGSTERIEVMWDAPIFHVKVNALNGWKFGIGDAYAALPWARGFKEFLEDWALHMKSVSRIAWQSVSGKKSDAQAKRQQLAALGNMPAGSIVNSTADSKLEAMPKSGVTINSESAKPLAAMVASALGLPVTMLLSDPGSTGARAVAETLDRPTRLEMQSRQEVWREARRQILGYVIDQAVLAPRGPLKGSLERDGDRIRVKLPRPQDRTLTITYPDLEEIPLDVIMDALTAANGHVPPLLIAELIMRALKVRDVDEWLEEMKDDDGNFIDPTVTAGQAAADAFRRGEDPASVLQ